MKYLTRHRPVTILLCLTLGLLLTACGGQSEPSPAEGSSSLAGALVGGKRSMVSESAQTTDPEKGAAALALLRESMAGEDQLAGAVAYLGHREQGEALPLTSWLEKMFPDLTEELPFLLEIPAERTLGPGYGDLYCIIPRDERTSLAVNHVTWQSQGNGVWPVADEVLYREEYAQPVFVFVNYETWPDEPDTEIGLVTNSGLEVKWYPMTDPSGSPIVPTGVDYAPMLMDIGGFSENIGPDDPENQEPTGDDWWLPPTDVGLGNTVWVCDGWLMELRQGGGGPNYAGAAELYLTVEDEAEMALAYSGVWRMEDDCLRLEISDGVGTTLNSSFPILISPSGEEMYFQRSRSGEGAPFLPDDMDSIGLTLSYG